MGTGADLLSAGDWHHQMLFSSLSRILTQSRARTARQGGGEERGRGGKASKQRQTASFLGLAGWMYSSPFVPVEKPLPLASIAGWLWGGFFTGLHRDELTTKSDNFGISSAGAETREG